VRFATGSVLAMAAL